MPALTAALACGQLGTDFDQVVALDLFLPDAGRLEVTDTLRPRARALNGRGDSVAAQIFWRSLDTAIVAVVDSTTGVTAADSVGTGRLQARVGSLRSNPQNVFVLPHLDTVVADGPTRDTVIVSALDSLSDSLTVRVAAPPQGTDPLASRRVVYAATLYTAGVTTVTLVPGDTVRTNSTGRAAAQVRLVEGDVPDSAVVTATLRRPDGTLVPGAPVTFVVEFLP